MLFNEDDDELYDVQGVVDNTEYHEEDGLLKSGIYLSCKSEVEV